MRRVSVSLDGGQAVTAVGAVNDQMRLILLAGPPLWSKSRPAQDGVVMEVSYSAPGEAQTTPSVGACLSIDHGESKG